MPKDIAKKNRDIRKEALREELKSRAYLNQVHSILESEYEPDQLPQAKMRLDGYFKLLAKTLPDLKAVEITGHVTSGLSEILTGLPDASATENYGVAKESGEVRH